MNVFGRAFQLSIFGESHGPVIGVVIDGLPAGLPLKEHDFRFDLSRRWPKITGVSPRREPDLPQIKSGWFNGRTTGAPLTIIFANKRVDDSAYQKLRFLPRPGHSDFAAWWRYGGFNDWRGAGHFSGRLTLALVAAGVVAKKLIAPTRVEAWLEEVGGSKNIQAAVKDAAREKDSLGALIACQAKPMLIGLGEPFFDSVESELAHLIFSIPGIKGLEFGAGFQFSRMRGSEANDVIADQTGRTETNHNGGVIGGLTNGNDLFFRVVAKPTPSIGRPQRTINLKTGKVSTIKVEGKHDICFALRLPVVIEAAVAIVLADLMQRAGLIPLIWKEEKERRQRKDKDREKIMNGT